MCNGMQNVEINEILQPIKGLGDKGESVFKEGGKKENHQRRKANMLGKYRRKKKKRLKLKMQRLFEAISVELQIINIQIKKYNICYRISIMIQQILLTKLSNEKSVYQYEYV